MSCRRPTSSCGICPMPLEHTAVPAHGPPRAAPTASRRRLARRTSGRTRRPPWRSRTMRQRAACCPDRYDPVANSIDECPAAAKSVRWLVILNVIFLVIYTLEASPRLPEHDFETIGRGASRRRATRSIRGQKTCAPRSPTCRREAPAGARLAPNLSLGSAQWSRTTGPWPGEAPARASRKAARTAIVCSWLCRQEIEGRPSRDH